MWKLWFSNCLIYLQNVLIDSNLNREYKCLLIHENANYLSFSPKRIHYPWCIIIGNQNNNYVVLMHADKRVTLVSPTLQLMNKVECSFMNHSVGSVFGNFDLTKLLVVFKIINIMNWIYFFLSWIWAIMVWITCYR